MAGTIFLVDGTALAYRAHFAMIRNPLRNSKGQETSASHGYLAALLKILREEKPEYMAVAFDRPEPTFRKERFPAYKATREKAPEEMVAQFPWIKQLTEALGIAVLEKPGFEADDLIGTAARRAEQAGLEVRIVSGDKDMMQLVTGRTLIYEPKGPELIGAEGVREKFGVPPERVVDVLGLMGDSSDNVPGVPLIGPKKAAALVQEFGSVEEVLARAPEGKPGKMRDNLIEFADQARLSRELVTIDRDVPIEISFDRLHPGRKDRERLVRLVADELEFSGMLNELFADGGGEADATGYRTVKGGPALAELARDLRRSGFFVVDTETTGLDALSADIVGASFSWKSGEATYVPWSDEAKAALRPVLEGGALPKGGQNMKYDAQVLLTHGIALSPLAFDTMLASYLLEPGRGTHNLDAMSLRHLGVRKIATEELIGRGKGQITMAEVEEEEVARYAAEDADCTFRLVEFFRPQLVEQGLLGLFEEVEMPLVPVLVAMERAGVKLDAGFLRAMGAEMEEASTRLIAELHELAGEPFNVNSPKQLGPILFEKLEIQKGSRRRVRRTRTGAYATDAETLENFAAHPIVAKLLEHREITKLKSTYVDALPQMVHPGTGRIHSSFNQAVAATGRLSSNDPNLQNIPIRTEMGRRIRKAFVAEEGCLLLSADYSQIELRLMAHLSGDPALTDVYRRGGDVHVETAARMFHVEPAKVTREQRGSAKAINFGILYGMGPQRLAQNLSITMDAAREFLEAYFREFPGVRAFQQQAVERARAEGFVTTLLGRRRAIPEIASPDPGVRANAENMAKNTPVQGTAADLIKVAMIRIHKRLAREGLASRMILQVHDELVFEGPRAEMDALGRLVRAEMEGALALSVPVIADVGIGANWLEAH